MADLTPISFVFLALLLIPVIIANKKLSLNFSGRVIYAFGRMAIQLTLVGLFLEYVFKLNSTLINILYVIVMIASASFSALKNSGASVKKLFVPILLSFLIPNIFMLYYLNFFVLNLHGFMDAQFTIPVSGMILGNSLTSIIFGLNTFYTSIQKDEEQYLYLLSLSCNSKEAVKPYFKEAIMKAINPAVATIETMGLVALPGMMTGQILGGASPLTAIKYQVMIMVAIFVSKYFGLILSIKLTSLKTFDPFGRIEWEPVKGKKGPGGVRG